MVPLDKQATALVCCTHKFYSRIYIKGINRTEKGRPMRKRMRRCLIALLLVLALTGSAFAAQYTAGTFEELEAAFADDSGDKEIHITLTGDIAFAGKLSAQEGKTFYIDGKAFTLKDVYLGGAGTVNVEAKSFEADSNDDAIHTADSVTVNAAGSVTTDGDHDGIQADDSSNLTFTGDIKAGYDGAEAFDDAKVTVNGSITAGENGVRARDNGSVTVNGNITAEDDDGVDARDNSNVTVNGNITASSDGIYARDNSTVTVIGDISSADADGIDAEDNTTVNVTGNITAEDNGIETGCDATITVTGDITAGDNGIDADENATVTVDGNVSSVNRNVPDENGNLPNNSTNINTDPGAYSDGGDGINADDNASVTVTGNVTGGDAYGSYGYAGDGVRARDNSTVSVGGNATGGSVTANPELDSTNKSLGGDGVNMDSTATVSVGGDAIGGSTNGKNGMGGSGAYIRLVLIGQDGGEDGGEIILSDGAATEPEVKAGSLTVGGTVRGGEAADKENGTNGAGIRWERESERIYYAAGDNEQVPEAPEYHVPEVTVHTVEGPDGLLFSAMEFDNEAGSYQENAALAAELGVDVNYTIWVRQTEGVTLSVDKEVAKAGETVTVTAKAADGYKLDGVYMSGTELTEADGAYTFTVPVGGDVEVSAKVTALPKEEEKDPGEEKKEEPPKEESPKEEPKAETPVVKNDPVKKSDAPKTGDAQDLVCLTALMLLSLTGLGALGRRNGRKKHQN